MALVGYSPFGSGAFPSATSAGGRVLDEIARAHAATPRQVALAFLTRLPGTFTIPKSADPARAVENAKAGGLRLSAPEAARIDVAFPIPPGKRSLPML